MKKPEKQTEIRVGDLVTNVWNDEPGVVVEILGPVPKMRMSTLYCVHTNRGIMNLWDDSVKLQGEDAKEV